jgi:hypothetical protein
MTRMTLPAITLFTFAILANAQDSPTSPANLSAPQARANVADRAQVDADLKRYESAYQHNELVRVADCVARLAKSEKGVSEG